MEDTSTLYLLCGKMAAGKSTLAKKLSERYNVAVFSEDELLAWLYPGEIVDVPTYVDRSSKLKSAIKQTVVQLLSNGTSLVLDFPANTAVQRAWLVALAEKANASHELHFIDASDSTCKEQLLRRAAENPQRSATDTIAMFDAINPYFEYPNNEEGLNIIRVDHDA